jgi:hypothetical protein
MPRAWAAPRAEATWRAIIFTLFSHYGAKIHEGFEAAAFYEFHSDEGATVCVFINVVHANGIGVLQFSGEKSFLNEAADNRCTWSRSRCLRRFPSTACG